MMGLPMAYHALGRKADSDAALAALIAKYGKDAPYDVAYIYAFRGEADQAFEWLDKAAAAHDTSLILLLVENLFTNIHSDPRWLSFLRKLGKAPEQLGKIPFKVTLPRCECGLRGVGGLILNLGYSRNLRLRARCIVHSQLRCRETVPALGATPRQSALRENRCLARAEMIMAADATREIQFEIDHVLESTSLAIPSFRLPVRKFYRAK